MGLLRKLFGKRDTVEDKISHASKIIYRVGRRIGTKYGENNVQKYLALYAAGEFMRESMETGEYEHYSDNYRSTKQQALLRKYLNEGINNLIEKGLDPTLAESQVRPHFGKLEAMAVDAVVSFVEINRKTNPEPVAFFTALRMFYDIAEAEMRKGFRRV